MKRSKIQNIVVHKSLSKAHFPNEKINEFSVSIIKKRLRDMPMSPAEKIKIIDEIIKILNEEGL